MKNLKEEFLNLSEDEKMKFVQDIMPEVYKIFKSNPQKMIEEFMPIVKEMIANEELDMLQLMAMVMQQDDDSDCCSGSNGCC